MNRAWHHARPTARFSAQWQIRSSHHVRQAHTCAPSDPLPMMRAAEDRSAMTLVSDPDRALDHRSPHGPAASIDPSAQTSPRASAQLSTSAPMPHRSAHAAQLATSRAPSAAGTTPGRCTRSSPDVPSPTGISSASRSLLLDTPSATGTSTRVRAPHQAHRRIRLRPAPPHTASHSAPPPHTPSHSAPSPHTPPHTTARSTPPRAQFRQRPGRST